MSNTIIMLIVTGAIVPFLAPFFLDAFAYVSIALMNIAKGKPTWKVGTKFDTVVWPNGFCAFDVEILAVTLRTVTLGCGHTQVTVKKRQMLGMICMIGVADEVTDGVTDETDTD